MLRRSLPVFPDKRTSRIETSTSEKCHYRTYIRWLLIPNECRAAEPIVPGQALDRTAIGLKPKPGAFAPWWTCKRYTGKSHRISIPLIFKTQTRKSYQRTVKTGQSINVKPKMVVFWFDMQQAEPFVSVSTDKLFLRPTRCRDGLLTPFLIKA
jgi:hypothetical protein